MSYYEHVFIARPEVAPQQVENIVEEIKKIVSNDGGNSWIDIQNTSSSITEWKKNQTIL